MSLSTWRISICAAVLLLGVPGGCASQSDLIAAGRVTLEPRIDRTLRRPPDVYGDKGDLVVAGRLERGLPRDLGGHVDVTVIAPDGATVYYARVNYQADTASAAGVPAPQHGSFRRARTRYGSYGVYSVRFPGLPPEGSVVKVRHDPQTEGHSMRIELLGFPDCPLTPQLRSNAQAALPLVPGCWVMEEVNQESLAPGDVRRGWPAPTLLVNGRDLFGMPAATSPSMGCRMYAGGVPSPEQIAERLRASVNATAETQD